MNTQSRSVKVAWEIPDWQREKFRCFWDPGRKLLKTIRDYQAVQRSKNPIKKALKKWCVVRHRFWSTVSGADIPLNTKIGGGLLIPHPNGIVIHPGSIIGQNCLIFQQVTIAGKVQIGYHVDIGAGAKILGPVVIGDNVRIGANSVVTKDVPAWSSVAGIPAKQL